MENKSSVVRGTWVTGAGTKHGAKIDDVNVTREVLVNRGEGVVKAVTLVVRRFVDQSVDRVEQGVAEGVAQEAGVARSGVGLDLDKTQMSKY